MQPRSAKYLRSATLVLGPNESIIELGEVGIELDGADCPWGDPGTLFVLLSLFSSRCIYKLHVFLGDLQGACLSPKVLCYIIFLLLHSYRMLQGFYY